VVRGDKVMIMEGKDKGQTGTVMRVYKKKNRLLVEGLNLCKKNIKRTETSPGGIITKEAPVHVSNVMVRFLLFRETDCEPRPQQAQWTRNSPETRRGAGHMGMPLAQVAADMWRSENSASPPSSPTRRIDGARLSTGAIPAVGRCWIRSRASPRALGTSSRTRGSRCADGGDELGSRPGDTAKTHRSVWQCASDTTAHALRLWSHRL
jgi:ribosomal protein L24